MKIINFGEEVKGNECVIVQPNFNIKSESVKVRLEKNKFYVTIGCQKDICIDSTNIADMLGEINGTAKLLPFICKVIIADGDKNPTEKTVLEGSHHILAEETEKFYISEEERLFRKDSGKNIVVDIKMSPRGKYFSSITKSSAVWKMKYRLSSYDIPKIKRMLNIINEYYNQSAAV